MNIIQFADLINQDLEITYYANQQGRYCAHFVGAEIKEGNILVSAHGNGPTPTAALNDYTKKIIGTQLVFYAHSPDLRATFTIPKLDLL